MTCRLTLDCTSNGCLILCADCPTWFAFRSDREAAWRAGRDHELRVHPGSTQATAALHLIKRRRR